MVIAEAKEELEILETQYPNKFQSLKLDLKTFISQLEDQEKLSSPSHNYSIPTSSVTTKVSSTRRKKRKKNEFDVKEKGNYTSNISEGESELEGLRKYKMNKRFCCCYDDIEMSTNAVIERARACLQKIQLFKTTFLSY